MKVAVIGYGSIGKRHAANIERLGHEVVIRDPEKGFMGPLVDVDAYVEATPASIRPRLIGPTFYEKPVATTSLAAAELFSEKFPMKQVGYNLRFDRSLRTFKSHLPPDIASVRIWFSQRLTDWRSSDYRTSVSAKKSLGGGILREASHELDLLRWLFGEWSWLYADVRRASDLDIDVEDSVSAIVGMVAGFTVELHLDMVQAGYRRGIEVVTRNGDTFTWKPDWQTDEQKNDMYLQEMRAFLKSVETGVLDPNAATLADGIEALRLVEACEESSRTRSVVYNPNGAEVEGGFAAMTGWRI